jgi:cellulose synthase/poly-beta-1,6-N-acetylglucosamine synthase-like glycosyltransferase
MIIVLCTYFFLLILYHVVLVILIRSTKDSLPEFSSEFPDISILVAARNEEKNIEACLNTLTRLSYPKEKTEILIGDDDSDDRTASIVNAFAQKHSNVRLFTIRENIGTARGKANVLAHLAHEAKGQYYFITDADILVPSNWIQSLLRHFKPGTGIVSGCTMSRPESFLGKAQQLDWLFAFGMMKVVSDKNIPVTAVGNNMAIHSEAYKSTGGYENIPFSVTEDQELFLQVIKKKWSFKNLMNAECLARTEPVESWKDLLKQRRRWMKGAMKIPFILLLCLFLQGVALPMLILMIWKFPVAGFILWGSKIFLQQVFLSFCFNRVGEKYKFPSHVLIFELYSMLLSPIVVLNYFFTRKIEWKGRVYR